MNKSDSERIASILENTGYKSASNIREADLILVNMCSVRQSAVDRVWGLTQKFKKLKTMNYKLQTVLTGCILRRDKKKFAKMFDLIFNIKDLARLPNILNTEYSILNTKDYLGIQPRHKTNFSAFIPISNGCNNFCAYCVVPFTRGSLICRDHREILKEAKDVAHRDFKEIWLLGQNVNDYSWNMEHGTWNKVNFAKLLRMVNDIPGNFWIRFTSSHPKDFSDELIKTIAECKKVTEYINLPVQSGDNQILKRMNRSYTIEYYKNLVKKIRKAIPNVCLSTDVIVGFPGETKKQFENTVSLFKEIKFDMAYISEYSLRSQTAAFKMKDNIPKKEKERRRKVLTEILKETALENNRKYIGKEVEALITKHKTYNLKQFCIGKTRHYKTIKLQVSGSKLQDLVGQFIKLKITSCLSWGLKGTVL